MDIKELVHEFNAVAGIEDAPAADGVWKFSADGAVFGVSADEAGERAYLFGEIPGPVPDKEEAFRRILLESNYFFRGTGGATLSLNPETGAYTLVASEWLDRLEPESFFAFVEKFVNSLVTWKAIAASAGMAGEEPPSSPDAEPEHRHIGEGGFIQV